MKSAALRFGRSVSVALIDQAILSAFNLGLNLALISLAGPEEFGRFILASAVILVVYSLQNALVSAPITMLLQGRDAAGQAELLEVVVSLDRVFRVLAALATAAVCALSHPSLDYLLTAVLAAASTLSRETVRTGRFARGQETSVLALDAATVVLSLAAAALAWQVLPPTPALLAGLAIGNMAALVILAPRDFPHHIPLRDLPRRYREYFLDTRWSLAGVVTTELQQRFYVFALELFRGTAVLASVQAGRLLLGPLGLATMALGRVARPKIALALAEGRTLAAKRLLWTAQGFTLVVAAGYFLALYLAWPLLESAIFKGRYEEVGLMTAAWSVYAFINVIEMNFSMFMQSAYRFRALAYNTITAASVSSVLLLGLALDVPPIYAVGAVTIGQIIVLALVAIQVRVLLRNRPDTGPTESVEG